MTTATGGSVTGSMGGSLASASASAAASDAAACVSRSYEVRQLAARAARCADQADAVLSQLARLELQTWQSPAGRAYRITLSLHAASLRRGRNTLQDAVAVVLRHAQNVVLSSGRPDF